MNNTRLYTFTFIIFLFTIGVSAQIPSFTGEWTVPNSSGESIRKVRISESEEKAYIQIWAGCTTGVCDWGKKPAIKYYETNTTGKMGGVSVRFDFADSGIYRYLAFNLLRGDSLEMTELTTFKNPNVKRLMKTTTLLKTDYTLLPAPVLVNPGAGSRIGKDGTLSLSWKPVSRAKDYILQVQYYANNPAGPGQSWQELSGANVITGNTFHRVKIDDIFYGRWRVKARGAEGVESEISEWRRFYYEIPQFTLTAPFQLLPLNNTVFDYNKRNMTFAWSPVPKATGYGFQVEFFRNGKWQKLDTKTVKESTMKYQVGEGLYKLRWRVWAKWQGRYSGRSFNSKSSPWYYFEHKQ